MNFYDKFMSTANVSLIRNVIAREALSTHKNSSLVSLRRLPNAFCNVPTDADWGVYF